MRVTWVPPGQRFAQPALRSTGRDTYNAEQFAKARRCSVLPMATLIEKGPGYERHRIPCSNGETMAVRCEFGNCRGGRSAKSGAHQKPDGSFRPYPADRVRREFDVFVRFGLESR